MKWIPHISPADCGMTGKRRFSVKFPDASGFGVSDN
jgi:hypothetical protein